MGTYENCYSILEDVRRGLNEYDSGYMQATDTTGVYSNEYLVQKINQANLHIYSLLLKRIRGEFTTSASLTGVNSVYTLPADFGVLLYFKDADGRQVFPISVKQKKLTNATGSDRYYSRKGRTLVLDKAGITAVYTLEYLKRPRKMTQGKASAGAATSITLATTASKLVDYYNGVAIENITKDWVDTIDDFATTRVATISETAAASDYYGTVSDIPEPFHHLIAPYAVILVKAEYAPSDEKPDAKVINIWNSQLLDTLRAFAGQAEDIPVEDIFEDFDTQVQFQGVISNA